VTVWYCWVLSEWSFIGIGANQALSGNGQSL
jgi:hypothetical protein